jgi:hypothetical protein
MPASSVLAKKPGCEMNPIFLFKERIGMEWKLPIRKSVATNSQVSPALMVRITERLAPPSVKPEM